MKLVTSRMTPKTIILSSVLNAHPPDASPGCSASRHHTQGTLRRFWRLYASGQSCRSYPQTARLDSLLTRLIRTSVESYQGAEW